jgi:hypothetical protein
MVENAGDRRQRMIGWIVLDQNSASEYEAIGGKIGFHRC